MLISFDCPKCLQPARGEVTSASRGVICTSCGWTKPLEGGSIQDETPLRCLVCGCNDLWRQKDFSPKVGVTIVAIAVLISTWFAMRMEPLWSLGTLMLFGLADMLLYRFMKDRLVCYRCHSIYQHVDSTDRISAFDLEVNERYRQEGIRRRQAESTSVSQKQSGSE